jgi:HK97 family phage major capsid protein
LTTRMNQLVEESVALITEARSIMDRFKDDDDMGEERARVDTLLAEAEKRKTEADALHGDEQRRQRIGQMSEWMNSTGSIEDPEERKEKLGQFPEEKRNQVELEGRAFAKFLRRGERGMTAEETRALTSGSDTAGGYLVPEDFRAQLIKALAGFTVVRDVATVMNTSRDTVVVPRLGNGPEGINEGDVYTSAVRITWAGETYEDDEGLTEPEFEQVRIPIEKAIAKTRISRDLLMDSAVSVEGVLVTLFGEAYGLGEDYAFLRGNGTTQPFGVMNDLEIKTKNIGVNISADSLIDLLYDLPTQYRARSTFYLTSAMEATIRKLKDANDVYIWQPGLVAGAPSQILGRPVRNTEFLPAPASAARSILLGDMSAYWIFDRMQMEVQRLDERYAEQGLVGWVLTKRVGGNVVLPQSFRIGVQSA